MTDRDNVSESSGSSSEDVREVTASAELTSVESELFAAVTDDSLALRPLAGDEEVDLEVVSEEVSRLWEERVEICREQPTVVGDDGVEVFGEDADEVAVRRVQRIDERLAGVLLSHQGLLVRHLYNCLGEDDDVNDG